MSSNNVPVILSSNDIPSTNDNDNGELVSPTTTTTAHQDSDAPIILPAVKYGYRTIRYEWAELKRIILIEQNLDRLNRSVDQQMEYERFKRQLKKTWKDVIDYVLCTKFKVPRMVDADTGLAYAYRTILASLTPEGEITTPSLPARLKIVVRNDFPYYMAENIHHFVLWKLHGICSDDDIQQAKEDVKQELELSGQAVVVDCLHWVNPPHLKSLPDIDHVHILCLLQPVINSYNRSYCVI
jgi:hypothetical protein